LAMSTLKFVRNRLAEVQATMLSLDRIMLPVLAKGKMKNSENYLWNNVAFSNWARNYEYAKTHCAPGILSHAHEARGTIVELESVITDLDVAQVEKKIGDVGKSLISLCKNSCKLFNEHDALPAADEPLLPPQLLPDVPESLKSIENQLQSEKKCIELGDSLSSLGYFSGWVATRSNSELAKFIMKVTLERRVARVARVAREPGRARDDDEDDEDDADDADDDDDHEVDIQVVEFWKRMGFEDIAEVVQLRSGGEAVLGVSCTGLEALCGQHHAELLRQLPLKDEKAQKASMGGEVRITREKIAGALRTVLKELEQDLAQRIPPGHAQILTRDLALELDMGKTQQQLQVCSMGFPSKNGAIVTMVRLQVTLRVTGRCINSRLKWDADLNVLVLPSLKEVVARVAEMSKQVEKDELVDELYKFVSAGTEIFQERFSPARYPEVQQWLQQGYQVTEVVGTPVNSESCAVS